ncbi:hypothetical protein NVS55_06180 [Myxococcus stipitatus]|uniref:TadE/TadG family type IV pilus assembly protein n=1 Tax=Myxococcus stipitatus TaxID=83455 RepID=UPI00314566B8
MRRRTQRGQAIVLGSLSFLVLALMVTLSFNLSHALRQKMSLQQHSDAMAYSMAVLEARALNYYAVSNRAIAGSYVAMNSLHAYMAAASVTGEMLRAGESNFNKIAAAELAKCLACRCSCCKHAADAKKVANKFGKKAREYDRDARALEGDFRTAMEGLDLMVDNLHKSQAEVHARTAQAVKDGSSHGLAQLKEDTAPKASELSSAVGALNENEFNCAVDGKTCKGSVESTSNEARARVMTEIGNASRSAWPSNRTGTKHLHPEFLDEFRKIPDEGVYRISGHKGSAKTVVDKEAIYEGGQSGGNEGTTVAASEEGVLHQDQWEDILPGMFSSDYESAISSDSGGGDHDGDGDQHRGSHQFEGTNARALDGCASGGNCFMKYRANPDPERDWGQPRVYSYYTMQLSVGNAQQAPWELNNSRSVEFQHGAQGSGKLTVAAGEGMSLSKALVYYHRFGSGGWKEPPNLFAPFWRAKLHPFKPGEAARVLQEVGNSDAVPIAETEVPL